MGLFTDDSGGEEFKKFFEASEKRLYQLFIEGYKYGYKKTKSLKQCPSDTSKCLDLINNFLNRIYHDLSRLINNSQINNLMKDPMGFGVALGKFFGLMKHNPKGLISTLIFKNESSYKNFINIIKYLKSLEGFDMNVVKKRFNRIDVSEFSGEEIAMLKHLISKI